MSRTLTCFLKRNRSTCNSIVHEWCTSEEMKRRHLSKVSAVALLAYNSIVSFHWNTPFWKNAIRISRGQEEVSGKSPGESFETSIASFYLVSLGNGHVAQSLWNIFQSLSRFHPIVDSIFLVRSFVRSLARPRFTHLLSFSFSLAATHLSAEYLRSKSRDHSRCDGLRLDIHSSRSCLLLSEVASKWTLQDEGRSGSESSRRCWHSDHQGRSSTSRSDRSKRMVLLIDAHWLENEDLQTLTHDASVYVLWRYFFVYWSFMYVELQFPICTIHFVNRPFVVPFPLSLFFCFVDYFLRNCICRNWFARTENKYQNTLPLHLPFLPQ